MEINDISSEISRIITTDTILLLRNEGKKSGQKVEYPELSTGIEELKSTLRLFNPDAYSLLLAHQQNWFKTMLNQTLQQLNKIQTQIIDEKQSLDQQKRQFREYFNISFDRNRIPDNATFLKHLYEMRKILVESLVLYNTKRIDEKPDNEIIQRIKQSEIEINKTLEQSKLLYSAAQTDLSRQGVGKHYAIFGSEADKNDNNATKWMNRGIIISITIGVIIIAMTCVITIWIEDKLNKIELGVSTALAISYLSYMLIVCFKNYFAEKHNQQLNQHRANCLSTYNTFIESSSEEIRNAVLLQTTQTIFAHQKTGYLANESDNQNPNPFVEIVHKAGDLKSGTA